MTEPLIYNPPLRGPKRPRIAVQAIFRKAMADHAARGENVTISNDGVPIEPDPNAVRCPITACDGAVRMTDALEMEYRISKGTEMSMQYVCPECGTTGVIIVPDDRS